MVCGSVRWPYDLRRSWHLVSSTYFFSVIISCVFTYCLQLRQFLWRAPVDIATAWLKASYFLSLAWVQCGIFWCRRILFSSREFRTITFKKKSHKVEFYKLLLNPGYFGNFTLYLRYAFFWSSSHSMQGGEALNQIYFFPRSGKQSTRSVTPYRSRYFIGFRWLASTDWR